MASIYIGRTDVNLLGFIDTTREHLFLVFDPDDDPSTIETQRIITGGPSLFFNDPEGLLYGNLIFRSNSNILTRPSYNQGDQNSELFDYTLVYRNADAGSVWNQIVDFSQTLGEFEDPVYNTNTAYNPFGPNSNSLISTLLNEAGLNPYDNLPTGFTASAFPGFTTNIEGAGNDILTAYADQNDHWTFIDNKGTDYFIVQNGATADVTKDSDSSSLNNVVLSNYESLDNLFLVKEDNDLEVQFNDFLFPTDVVDFEQHFGIANGYNSKFLFVVDGDVSAADINIDENIVSGTVLKQIDLTLLDDFPGFVAIPLSQVVTVLPNSPDITASSSDDFIFGDEQNNIIIGNGGSDRVFGSLGNDTIIANIGSSDTIDYSGNSQSISLELSTDLNSDFLVRKDLFTFDILSNVETLIGTSFQFDTINIDPLLVASVNKNSISLLDGRQFELVGFERVRGTNDSDDFATSQASGTNYDGLGGENTITYSNTVITDIRTNIFGAYQGLEKDTLVNFDEVSSTDGDVHLVIGSGTVPSNIFEGRNLTTFDYSSVRSGIKADIDGITGGGLNQDGNSFVGTLIGSQYSDTIENNNDLSETNDNLPGYTAIIRPGAGNDTVNTGSINLSGTPGGERVAEAVVYSYGNDTYNVFTGLQGFNPIELPIGAVRLDGGISASDVSVTSFETNFNTFFDRDTGFTAVIEIANRGSIQLEYQNVWLFENEFSNFVITNDATGEAIVTFTPTYNPPQSGGGVNDGTLEWDFTISNAVGVTDLVGTFGFDTWEASDDRSYSFISYDGADSLSFKGGDDEAYTGDGNDKIRLGLGNNVADTGDGDDIVYLGEGSDTITTGLGSDQLIILNGSGASRVTDFDINQDKLNLINEAVFDASELTVTDTTEGAVIDFGNGQTLQLDGVSSSDLISSNSFVFASLAPPPPSDVTLPPFPTEEFFGTESNNFLSDFSSAPRALYGLGGDDNLSTSTHGGDYLFGGEGDDTLNSNTIGPANVLDGGAGSDTFFGAEGDDFYIFNATESGQDSIEEQGGFDTIIISNELDVDDLEIFDADGSLYIGNLNTAYAWEGVTVQNYFFAGEGEGGEGGEGGGDPVVEQIVVQGTAYDLNDVVLNGFPPGSGGGGGGQDPADNNPIAADDSFIFIEGEIANGNLLIDNGNGVDYDPNDIGLSVVPVTQTFAFGQLSIESNGNFTLTPNEGYTNEGTPFNFTYTLVDPDGNTAQGNAAFEIIPQSEVPTLNVVDANVDENGSIVISASNLQVSDPDGNIDESTFTITFLPLNGVLTINGVEAQAGDSFTIRDTITSAVVYTPNANFFGTDSFDFFHSDGQNILPETTLNINVIELNDDPVANDDVFDVAFEAAVTGNVLDNDTDENAGDVLSVVETQVTTAQGVVVDIASNGEFTYTGPTGFSGADSFTYTVDDGNGGTDTATVTINVEPDVTANQPPVANADTAVTDEDMAVIIDVLANDTDPDADTLDVTAVTQGANGSVVINGDGTVTYTPNADFFGTDSFSYDVTDGTETVSSTVDVTVNAVNDAPTVSNNGTSLDEDTSITLTAAMLEALDIDNTPAELVFTLNAIPVNSDLQLNGVNLAVFDSFTMQDILDGNITFTPDADRNGSFAFDFTLSDGEAVLASQMFMINVNPINDNPVAANDSFSGDRDQDIAGNILVDNGNGADSDIDLDALSVVPQSFTTAQGGTVTLLANGDFTYTPEAFFVGDDSFDYELADGQGGSAFGTVTLTLNALAGDNAGTSGDDVITDGNGDGVIFGGAGNDTIESGNGSDTIGGGSGDDTLIGGNGNDIIYGGSGDDIISGEKVSDSNGNDELHGGSGNDLIDGGNGSDILYGDEGLDTLIGGNGSDTFVFEAPSAFDAIDIIEDFTNIDAIDVADLLFGYDPLVDAITDYVQVTDNGTDSFLSVDSDGGADAFVQIATLQNVTGLTDEADLESNGQLITV